MGRCLLSAKRNYSINGVMEQRTAEWYRARLGRFTGSGVWALMGSGRVKGDDFSQTGKSYILSRAAERNLCDELVNDDMMLEDYMNRVNPQTRAMEWGILLEDEARGAYQELTHNRVELVGFIPSVSVSALGSSPDGVVWTASEGRGALEIKCPTADTFFKYATGVKDNESLKKVCPEYYWQCQCHMLVLGVGWCDFVVYHPLMRQRITVTRIVRDDDAITAMIAKVKAAEEMIEELNKNLLPEI